MVKAGVFGSHIYFCFEWDDTTYDAVHKPFVWDNSQNKYVAGSEREDRFAIQFEINGNYTTDWMSGREFTADMWHSGRPHAPIR